MTQGMSASDTVDGLGAAPSVTHECVTRAMRVSWESSARLPQSAGKKSAIRRSARLISRSTSVAGQAAERGRLLRQECLEAQPLGQQQLQALSLERPGEDLGEELEALHELVRPGALSPERVKDQTPSIAPRTISGRERPIGFPRPGSSSDRSPPPGAARRSSRTARRLPAGPGRPPMGTGRPRESGPFCRRLRPPRRCERWSREGNMLDEAGPIHPQELHDTLQPAFDFRVHIPSDTGIKRAESSDTRFSKRNRSASKLFTRARCVRSNTRPVMTRASRRTRSRTPSHRESAHPMPRRLPRWPQRVAPPPPHMPAGPTSRRGSRLRNRRVGRRRARARARGARVREPAVSAGAVRSPPSFSLPHLYSPPPAFPQD